MAGIRIRSDRDGELVSVRALLSHPMETGRRRDTGGATVPAHYIERLTCEHNGRIVLDTAWGTGIARNPLLGFRLKGTAPGDVLRLHWVDNLGTEDAIVHTLP
ncbi:MAG: thiosulfate oxidation carrier complex protein SoxZ [Gammaproteobacteria bacterium]|nr:thiosulfate oxidation carrier complex protein SoxZ [Gammaproteobacteria bacterium]